MRYLPSGSSRSSGRSGGVITNTELHLRVAPLSPVTIRPAVPTDDWAVRHLFGALHAFNASLEPRFVLAEGWEDVLDEHLAHGRAEHRGLTLLAWDEGMPVGLLMMDGHTDSPLFLHRHWAELLALYVVPSERGAGVADRLMAGGLRWAEEWSYTHVQLYVTATNLRAKRFYTRAGFRPVQEVWGAAIGSADGRPPDDPACEAAYAHGHHLLSPTHHPTAGDEGHHQGEETGRDDRCTPPPA